jgi:serine/threonine protein kinase
MRKSKIFLAALVLMAVAAAVLARDQLNRDIILLKDGRIIPVDRVWESGADLFYENDKEIRFISLTDIQSIEKQSLTIWWRTTGDRVADVAGRTVKTLNPLLTEGVALVRRPSPFQWLLIGAVAVPLGLVYALRGLGKRSKKKKSIGVAPPAKEIGQEMPHRADVVRFFLGLYRQQLGFGPEVPADFVQLQSAPPAGSNQVYELRVKNGSEWVKRRMTLGPLGEDSGSKSKCYYIIFDQHLVVKIPPKPITDFEDYVASIQKERHIVERLRPKECIVPRVSVILSQVHRLSLPPGSLPEVLEEKYIAWLRKTPAHQEYLKINGTFVFFMDLSRYYFLSHIIDSLHDLAEPIRSELNSTADLIRYPAKFKERYGEQNESVGFEIRDLYHQCEAEVVQLLKNAGKSAAVTPYRLQVWFLNFLEKKHIGETESAMSGRMADEVGAVFARWFEKHRGAVEAYLAAIRTFTARLGLEQNRQIIAGIATNLLDLLAWLNEKRVALRDLKPDNLLVAGDPQHYPAFLRSPSDYALGVIDVETAVYLDPSQSARIKQPLLGGTPYYATPSHLFPNTALNACFADAAQVLGFQDWHAVLVMVFKAVTGDLLFDRTAKLFGGIKNRVADTMRQRAPLEPLIEDVSRTFWRSAAGEFRAKMKARESALRSVEIDIPKTAKALLIQVLQRDIASIHQSMRRLVGAQTHFSSPASREQLLKSSHKRIGQMLKALQTKRELDPPGSVALEATERFLSRLCILKALMERKSQLAAALEATAVPRLNAHELLLLMFNSVLKSMCREQWYSFAEEATRPHLPSDNELSLATTI